MLEKKRKKNRVALWSGLIFSYFQREWEVGATYTGSEKASGFTTIKVCRRRSDLFIGCKKMIYEYIELKKG